MRLLLLRHAKAEKGALGGSDRERTLNPRGRQDAGRIGAYLAHHQVVPARALVSPAQRTRETWERLAAALPAPAPVLYEDGLYNAGPDAIMTIIRKAGRAAPVLLVIGHNPGLHAVARLLIAAGDVGARERLNEGMPTSALAIIDFAGDDWDRLHPQSGRLERFVSPRTLAAATD